MPLEYLFNGIFGILVGEAIPSKGNIDFGSAIVSPAMLT